MGLIKPLSYRTQCCYIITFTDDVTCYTLAFEITNKTNVNLALVSFFEEIRGYKPGCEAHVLDNLVKLKSKWAPRANLSSWLECGETGYTLFSAQSKTIVRSQYVEFVENYVFLIT